MTLYQSSGAGDVADPTSSVSDPTFNFEPSAEWSFVVEGDPFWIHEPRNLASHYEGPTEVEALREAAASGDLTIVRETFTSQWVNKREDRRVDKDLFATSLVEAIKLDNVSIAAYLLSEGIPMNISHFVMAAEMKRYSMLQLFLDMGWNINTPVERTKPPPLS